MPYSAFRETLCRCVTMINYQMQDFKFVFNFYYISYKYVFLEKKKNEIFRTIGKECVFVHTCKKKLYFKFLVILIIFNLKFEG